MWTITQLKERGRQCFNRNFWRTVLVALVVVAIGGTQGGNTARSISILTINLFRACSGDVHVSHNTRHLKPQGKLRNNNPYTKGYQPDPGITGGSFSFGDDGTFEFDFGDDFGDDFDDDYDEFNPYYVNPYEEHKNTAEAFSDMLDGMAVGMIILIIALATLVGTILLILHILVDIFFRNPLFVGTQRFFIHNLKEEAMIADLGFGFDRDYRNQVKIMFLRDLYTFAWGLLFVIPGIYKSYEYRMVPYLLAEYPHMSKEQAFYTSKYLMHGDKWRTFLLDISFVGWWILSVFTVGVLGIFYVNPYYNSTCAALYEALKAIKGIPAFDQTGPDMYGMPGQTPGFGGENYGQGGFGAGAFGSGSFGAGAYQEPERNPQIGYGESQADTAPSVIPMSGPVDDSSEYTGSGEAEYSGETGYTNATGSSDFEEEDREYEAAEETDRPDPVEFAEEDSSEESENSSIEMDFSEKRENESIFEESEDSNFDK